MSQTLSDQRIQRDTLHGLDNATDLLSSTESDFIQLERDQENSLIFDKLMPLLSTIKTQGLAVTPAAIDTMLEGFDIRWMKTNAYDFARHSYN